MSDSQRFPVAAHVLAYLAHKDALSAGSAVSSSELAQSVATNPVVVTDWASSLEDTAEPAESASLCAR